MEAAQESLVELLRQVIPGIPKDSVIIEDAKPFLSKLLQAGRVNLEPADQDIVYSVPGLHRQAHPKSRQRDQRQTSKTSPQISSNDEDDTQNISLDLRARGVELGKPVLYPFIEPEYTLSLNLEVLDSAKYQVASPCSWRATSIQIQSLVSSFQLLCGTPRC